MPGLDEIDPAAFLADIFPQFFVEHKLQGVQHHLVFRAGAVSPVQEGGREGTVGGAQVEPDGLGALSQTDIHVLWLFAPSAGGKVAQIDAAEGFKLFRIEIAHDHEAEVRKIGKAVPEYPFHCVQVDGVKVRVGKALGVRMVVVELFLGAVHEHVHRVQVAVLVKGLHSLEVGGKISPVKSGIDRVLVQHLEHQFHVFGRAGGIEGFLVSVHAQVHPGHFARGRLAQRYGIEFAEAGIAYVAGNQPGRGNVSCGVAAESAGADGLQQHLVVLEICFLGEHFHPVGQGPDVHSRPGVVGFLADRRRLRYGLKQGLVHGFIFVGVDVQAVHAAGYLQQAFLRGIGQSVFLRAAQANEHVLVLDQVRHHGVHLLQGDCLDQFLGEHLPEFRAGEHIAVRQRVHYLPGDVAGFSGLCFRRFSLSVAQ